MAVLENNKVRNARSKEKVAPTDQKLAGQNRKIEWGIQRSIGSVLRRYADAIKQEETKGDAKLLSKHCLVDSRVEDKRGSSVDSPPCLDFGKDDRKLRLGGKLEQNNY